MTDNTENAGHECEGFDLYLETLRPTVRSDS